VPPSLDLVFAEREMQILGRPEIERIDQRHAQGVIRHSHGQRAMQPGQSSRDEAQNFRRDFIFADSDRVRLTRSMLRDLSPAQLRIARNEIYARRGRYFRDPALAQHFGRFSWYRPYSWEVPLNAVEQANVELIAAAER